MLSYNPVQLPEPAAAADSHGLAPLDTGSLSGSSPTRSPASAMARLDEGGAGAGPSGEDDILVHHRSHSLATPRAMAANIRNMLSRRRDTQPTVRTTVRQGSVKNFAAHGSYGVLHVQVSVLVCACA